MLLINLSLQGTISNDGLYILLEERNVLAIKRASCLYPDCVTVCLHDLPRSHGALVKPFDMDLI